MVDPSDLFQTVELALASPCVARRLWVQVPDKTEEVWQVPDEIARLTLLEELFLDGHAREVANVEALAGLPALRSLSIGYRLRVVPEALGALGLLEELALRGQFDHVPEAL